MKFEQLRADWLAEQDAGITGWDWSRVDARIERPQLPWSYQEIVLRHLNRSHQLLDMGTGGGEVMLRFGHPRGQTSVTEGWEPNLALCREKLAPLGVRVEQWEEPPTPLPFDDASFDVVTNRHDCYDPAEVWRVLKPNGVFITQQVGGGNDLKLAQRLYPGYQHQYRNHVLSREVEAFVAAGFDILLADETVYPIRYADVGAIVFTASVLPWEFPDFSVDKHLDTLCRLHEEIEAKGYFESCEHRFVFVARKHE